MDDLTKNFLTVPKGYGEVAFYWWVGDKLTKERLLWQLDKLKDHAISGIQINYAHTDKGGDLWGLTIESDPKLFSEEWWELFGWYMKECRKYGISVSLSDYTLGSAGQGWFVDELLRDNPDKLGQSLEYVNGKVSVRTVKNSFNPIQKGIGDIYISYFYKRFEERFPGECGKGLNFFFSDELNFGIRGNLWCDDFEEQFERIKGYSIRPFLEGIFIDIGVKTPKIRLDYYDVIVRLSEERFFEPMYRFHEDRNMIFGCDHGGRGKDITEFGDYFRTMKWNQGPGNDQPSLESDIVKNKVSSSIAHLYKRPRTWLEGFYGSGWGTSSEDIADATFRNFAMGHNLLTLHGLYYSTYGGWWEWAPPCNHFRMPYWTHLKEFLNCSERLSYLLSQGVHVCDIAIVYPIATCEGNSEEGEKAANIAFEAANHFYKKGLDFDFIDFESIERAEIVDSHLCVSDECYKVLLLPGMKTVRYGMLKKLLEFQELGGIVICIDTIPEASDLIGRHNEELKVLCNKMRLERTVESTYMSVSDYLERDFECENMEQKELYFLHRRVGSKDIYMVYGTSKNEICTFRSTGSVEFWDPWTSQIYTLNPTNQTDKNTSLKMPLDKNDVQIIVFDKEKISSASPWQEYKLIESIEITGKWGFTPKPTLDNLFGDYRLPATKEFIGPEIRTLNYKREGMNWEKVSCGYGPKFLKAGPIHDGNELLQFEESITALSYVSSEAEYCINNANYRFEEYKYSERMGVEGDPGHQGYHGLKGEMSNEFLVMGKPQWTMTSTEYRAEDGDIYYFWTSVHSNQMDHVTILTGEFEPKDIWINGKLIKGNKAALLPGVNTILLKYKGTGRSYFILEKENKDEAWIQSYPLSMQWYNNPNVYAFDCFPQFDEITGEYAFQSPPGLAELKFSMLGEIEVWVDGEKLKDPSTRSNENKTPELVYVIENPKNEESNVTIKINHKKGLYGGSAYIEPIKMSCQKGLIDLGDWSLHEGLYSYSGGAYYDKTITITKEQLQKKLTLCLGEVVSSAEVSVNGKIIGVKVAPSWEFDITSYVVEGENELQILVYNTLSNHYTSIPTRYRGKLKSGLIGPVTLKMEEAI